MPLPSSDTLDEGNFTAAFEALSDCDAEPGTDEFKACVADLIKAKMSASSMSDTSGGFVAAAGALTALAGVAAIYLN